MPGSQNGASVLQQRYDLAQKYQAAHDLPAASEQYRIFLADGLGELAIGYAQARAFEQSADYFDEALRLVPEFPVLRLQYARAVLQEGKLDRARLEAERVLSSRGATKPTAAGAHEVIGRALLRQDRNKEAKEQLEEAVALDSTFDNGYELAIAELDLGDQKAAATLFNELLKAYGDQPVLHMYFGRAYGGSDFQAESLAEFQKALAGDPTLPGLHYCLAAAYLAGGDAHIAQAETELRREIQISPKDAEAYAALGHLLAEGSTPPSAEAESDLKKATALDPQNPDAFLFLGQLYAAQNRETEAVTALQQAIKLTTDPARNGYQIQKAHYVLGRLMLKSGQTAQGQAELALSQQFMHNNLHRDQKRLSEYLHDDNDAQSSGMASPQGGSVVRSALEPAQGLERVKALAARLSPAIADSYNNLGAMEAEQNHFRAAVLSFRRAAEWNPQLPGLDTNWGRAAFAAGMSAEAIEPLQRYLHTHPEDDGARAVLGICLFQEKQYTSARQTLAPLQNKPGIAPQVQFAYADSLLETGDTQGGVAQLETLAKANPEIEEIHSALGKAYAATETSRAAQEYETALKLNPNDAQMHAALGRLDLQRGQKVAALEHLRRAVQLEPQDASLRQQLADATDTTGKK